MESSITIPSRMTGAPELLTVSPGLRKDIGSGIFPDYYYPAIEVTERLLPEEVIDNLVKGTPIKSNSAERGSIIPYFYDPHFVAAVGAYILRYPTLYSSNSFRRNVIEFSRTFGLPTSLHAFGSEGISVTAVPLRRRGFIDPSIHLVDSIPMHQAQTRVFMHGRFNGWVHPADLETILLAKRMFPGCEFWLGIDSPTSSIEKGQPPFMDIQFKISLFKATGLVDQFILLDPPTIASGYSEDEIDMYWDLLYSISGNLDPDVIVTDDIELVETKIGQVSIRTKILHLGHIEFKNRFDSHRSGFRDGSYPQNRIETDWDYIRELLAAP